MRLAMLQAGSKVPSWKKSGKMGQCYGLQMGSTAVLKIFVLDICLGSKLFPQYAFSGFHFVSGKQLVTFLRIKLGMPQNSIQWNKLTTVW